MTRLANSLMQGGSFSYGRKEPMLDPRFGGQNGYAPDLAQLTNSTKYARRNTSHMLMEPPRGFLMMPDSEYYIAALKAMIELHAQSWEGFNSGLTVATAESAVGGANEMLETPVNVTRERSNPQCTVIDLYGRPFQNLLHDWITYLIGDPETKTPMLTTIADVNPADMLSDIYGMTMLSWEPDPTNTKVAKAWLSTAMYPKATGDILGKRDLTNGFEHSELNIQWTGVTQTGAGVVDFAQSVMDRLVIKNANPMMRQAFLDKIDPNVTTPNLNGYAGSSATLAAQAIMAS